MKTNLIILFFFFFLIHFLVPSASAQTLTSELILDSENHVRGVYPVDEHTVWVHSRVTFGSYNFRLYRRTSNGDWIYCKRNGLDTNDRYYAFYAFDSLNAYVANYKDVYRTTDGGENFSHVISSWGTGFINDIIFSKENPLVGYINSDPINGNGSLAPVFKTIDGGENWDTVFMHFGWGFVGLTNSIFLSGTEKLYIGGNGTPYSGSNARIHFTSNGGSNWSSFTMPGNNVLYQSINFKEGDQVGIITASTGTSDAAYRTTNSGQNWNVVFNFSFGSYTIIKQALNSNTWYLIDSRQMYKSIDDGNNWNLLATINNGTFSVLNLYQDSNVVHVWCYGLPGTVLRLIDTIDLVSNISQIGEEIPSGYEMKQNFPNPFNPVTILQFSIPTGGHVTLKVFNSLGQLVNTLVDENLSQGIYNYSFDASGLSSGVYFYRLESADFVDVKRMLLVK